MVADQDLKFSLDHQIEFLTLVGSRMDRRVLLGFGIVVFDPVRFGDLFLEQRSHVFDQDAVFMGRSYAAAFTGNRIGGEAGGAAFHQVDDLNAKSVCALMDKGEWQVFFS